MIEAKALSRRYGDFTAVREVSFTIGAGEIVGLLGHNGAGKTTIMKMLTGYLEPSAGSAWVHGEEVEANRRAAQALIGYLPESLPVYPEMMVADYLAYVASLRGVAPRTAVPRAIAATELESKALQPIATLSRGFKQRVGVAQAILHEPRCLILDEPTNGLDPEQTQHMRDLIRGLGKDTTVILSTHIMQEVDAVCDRALILRAGKLVLDKPLADLRSSDGLRLRTNAGPDVVASLKELASVEAVHALQNDAFQIECAAGKDETSAAVAQWLADRGQRVFELAPERRDLETVFREANEGGLMMRFDLILRTAKKELTLFFSSAVAYLFIAVFLGVSLFVVFFSEAFFVRNIADVRPLFEWMPLLLLFLSAAITMRLWSEERRTGTLEFVSTVPVSAWEFVLGKFLACWTLLGYALLLTLPLPVSVAFLGDLDWGPVWAGYLAAMLLGASYIAMGLFVSAWSDSQIVSLLVAIVLGGAFYLLGSPVLTNLFDSATAELLRGFGTGARFESITRGVVDLRDLYYYLALAAVFLALNVYGLESGRWAADGDGARHSRWRIGTAMLIGNLVLGNVLLQVLKPGRLDMTEGQLYSISEPTRAYLTQLQEPLLIRGYFSEKTHPLLVPLVPQMRDLLLEYQAIGGDRVRVEFVDPMTNPELEDEANTKYGITAVPFQVSDRYQASLVNSYFDVLVSYGDQFEVLNFRDLIDVKAAAEDQLDVALRNPEYDITRSIKKVLFGFQGSGALFASIPEPVNFVGYVSSDARLPEQLVAFNAELKGVLTRLGEDAEGRLAVSFVDPQAGDGALANQLEADYGFRPMATSLFDAETFYYYLTVQSGDTLVQVPLPESLDAESAERVLNDSLKRFAKGVLKTVGFVAPAPPPPQFLGMPAQGGNRYQQLSSLLEAEFVLERTDLADGRVPANVDLLMLVEPTSLSAKALFAVDQFLMRGGTVVINSSPFGAALGQQSMTVTPRTSGIEDWLAHHGLTLMPSLVLDPQSSAFPVPVTRQAGGFSFQELVLIDYPYFVDLRGDSGFASESPVTADLPQLTVSWASPIRIDEAVNEARSVTTLLRSSPESWLSADTNVLPQIDAEGRSTFVPTEPRGAHKLAVVVEGRFDSYFKGKEPPLLETPENASDAATAQAPGEESEAEQAPAFTVASVVERSSDSARLYLIASNDFLADQITQMVGSADGTYYTNAAQFMSNIVDYSLEDQSLLSIASRGSFNRTLPPLSRQEQNTLELLNYGLAALGIVVLWLWQRRRLVASRESYRSWLEEVPQ